MIRTKKTRAYITQAELKDLLHYNPETGDFVWLVNRTNGIKVGNFAGCFRGSYRVISIKNVSYAAHRLAFLYMAGRFPHEYIDHINGVKSDNRWVNLREATNGENQYNRSGTGSNCGIKNVTYVQSRNRFQVSLKVSGKEKFIGYFEDIELAELVSIEAREKYHGHFAKHI